MDVRNPIAANRGDVVTKYGETWKTQVAALQQKFGDQIEEVRMPGDFPTDLPTIFVKKNAIVDVLRFMKSETGFEYAMLSDITATDETPDEPRFHVVYHLYSVTRHYRIRLKVRAAEGEAVPTAVSVWPAANWAEREIWDMFGVKFEGHPDLRRILMDARWEGHPLRKDYPLRGYQVFSTPEEIDAKLLD